MLASPPLARVTTASVAYGAHQLRPIFLQQLGARKNVGPDNFSVHGDHDAHRILIAQLADDAFVVALHRFGDSINLLLNFLVIHNPPHRKWSNSPRRPRQ